MTIGMRLVGLKWGFALTYLAVCLGTVLLLPRELWPVLFVPYILFTAWTYWTVDDSYGRDEQLRPLTRWDVPEYDRFIQRLREATIDVGISREPIWAVLEDDQPNAYALPGRRGIIAFSTGLLRSHTADELLAIAGHELRHLASRDSLPAIVGGSWLALVGYFSNWLYSADVGGGILRAVFQALSLVLDLLLTGVGWVAHAVLAKRSRLAEHLADLEGARITSASTMIRALEKLKSQATAEMRRKPARWSPAWIAHQLHASHPETAVRIQYLKEAAQRGEVNE